MGIAVFIVFVIAIAGAIVWFFVKNKKKPSEQQTDVKPPVVETPVAEPTKPAEPEPKPEPSKPSEPVVNEPGQSTTEEPEPAEQSSVDEHPVQTEPETPTAEKPNEEEQTAVTVEEPKEEKPSVDEQPKEEKPANEEKPALTVPADDVFDNLISVFVKIVKIPKDGVTYKYLMKLYKEAEAQYYSRSSANGIPVLVTVNNFPYVYDYYGDKANREKAFKTLVGWLFALQLSELRLNLKNSFFKAGYEYGGYTRNDNLYGYEFMSDPNVMRIIAGAIYTAMRGTLKPDTDKMLTELKGKKFTKTLKQLISDESKTDVADDAFYIDLRKFMNSAAGPYAPGYTDRSKNNPTFPDAKEKNGCLKMDMTIHNHITKSINLYAQAAVQATADKDWDVQHLFGDDKVNVHGMYHFDAVFGKNTIGMKIDPKSSLATYLHLLKYAGSNARAILQHKDSSVGPVEYGRLRPGSSWTEEGKKHSDDITLDVLTDFWIEDGDGNPTGYYNEDGTWVNPKEVKSSKQYEEMQRNALYGNSYPSGHSSGIMCAALALIEKYPKKADLILREANQFAVNRTIARYHWNSDTIQGRVLGTAMNAVCHAVSDYDKYI